MSYIEYLLTSCETSQQFSACLWDYNTLNVKKYYKNGGTIAHKCLEYLGQDYILAAELAKPLLHVWPLNSQDVAKNIRLILPEPATCLAASTQGDYLAVGIGSKLFTWQLASGKLLSVQQKHFQSITSMKFSSGSDFLLVGGKDGMLVAYLLVDIVSVVPNFMEQSDIGQAEPLYVKKDHSMPIRDIHIGHFGRKSRFATVSTDQSCRIYMLSSGENLFTLVFNEGLTSVSVDPPCWNLFIGSDSGCIRQYDLKNSHRSVSQHIDEKSSVSFIGHKKKIVCLALNAASSILASGSEDNFVYIWEIKSRHILHQIEHKSPLTNIKFVPDYLNFFVENFKPTLTLKNLQRSYDDRTDFTITILQPEDIEFESIEEMDNLRKNKEELMQENRKLRAMNKQVYEAALSIREKYKT